MLNLIETILRCLCCHVILSVLSLKLAKCSMGNMYTNTIVKTDGQTSLTSIPKTIKLIHI